MFNSVYNTTFEFLFAKIISIFLGERWILVSGQIRDANTTLLNYNSIKPTSSRSWLDRYVNHKLFSPVKF